MQPKYTAIYRAIVTSTIDATNSGKIRVQCPQVAGLAEIRSAEPVNPQQPIPSVGTLVWLMFSGGDITKPAYFSNAANIASNYTWQTPTYETNWAGSTTFNTSTNWGTLQYRFDTEDNVWLVGGFKTTGAAATLVFNLPAAYRPQSQWAIPCQQSNSGTLSYISLAVASSGNVIVATQVGGDTTSGNEYLVNGKFPLGNLS